MVHSAVYQHLHEKVFVPQWRARNYYVLGLKIAACHTVLYQDMHHGPLDFCWDEFKLRCSRHTEHTILYKGLRVGSFVRHHWRI